MGILLDKCNDEYRRIQKVKRPFMARVEFKGIEDEHLIAAINIIEQELNKQPVLTRSKK